MNRNNNTSLYHFIKSQRSRLCHDKEIINIILNIISYKNQNQTVQ